MRHRILRAVTFLIIFFFAWTMGGMFNIAYAAYNEIQKPAADQKQSLKPEEKFQKAVDSLKDVISRKASWSNRRSELKEKRNAIESLDVEIKSQFAETEKKLRNAGLPQEILQRHYNFVKHYEDNLKELRANLDAADIAKTDTEFETHAQKIRQHLEKTSPPRKHKPLDPNKLPHRLSDIKRKEPRTKPEEFQKDIKQTAGVVIPAQAGNKTAPVSLRGDSQAPWQSGNQPLLLASNGPLSGLVEKLPKNEKQQSSPQPLVLALAHDTPTSDDLAETVDVQLTSAIRAKAAELNYSPVKIYNWVRNNVEYVPTYGSIQGADMCMQTLQGNDFDIASLLIALLRASGIHARYVYGTIELPINKVMNWVGGFTNAQAALDFIASGGTPVAGLISGGKISSVRMEHVWVEAYVKYYPLRGAKHITGQGDSWIPLDASYKQYNYTQGIDIKSAVPFDAQGFVNQIQSTANIDTTNSSVTNINATYIQQQMQNYQTQVQNYITQNYPNATVGDVLGKKEIIKQNFTYLLGTLPYRNYILGVRYSEIPDNLRHKIIFKVTKDIYDTDTSINITKSLPEIAGKKITLSYSPATADDEAVINSYLPKPHADGSPIQPSELPTSLPAYLINLKPELRIDGLVVATGTTIGMGYQEIFEMVFTAPQSPTDVVSNRVDAGAYYAIAIDNGKISKSQITALKTKLETTKAKLEVNDFTTLSKDDLIGDVLYTTALTYYAQLDSTNIIQSKPMGIIGYRLPSESIFSTELKVEMMFGIPRTVSVAGLMMDVDRNLHIALARDGNKNLGIQFMLTSGQNSSALEHAVPEQMFSTQENPAQGISAVKALKIANDQGIPIYTVNQSNVTTILPQLQVDDNVKADIQNAVNAGKEVTVSKTNIILNGWTGCGYIITNPNTGAAAYMISGGLCGGHLIEALIAGILAKYGIILLILGTVVGIGIPAWVTLLGAILVGLALGIMMSSIFDNPAAGDIFGINYLIRGIILPFLIASGAPGSVFLIVVVCLAILNAMAQNLSYKPFQRKRYYAYLKNYIEKEEIA